MDGRDVSGCRKPKVRKGDIMGKRFTTSIAAVVLMLSLAGSASAFEICFGFSGYGNKFKLEATQFGNFFQLSGSERVFAERSVNATAYMAANNRVRMGLLQVANQGPSYSDIIWNADLSLSTLSGPITGRRVAFGDDISDTLSSISCSGVAEVDNRPDALAK